LIFILFILHKIHQSSLILM